MGRALLDALRAAMAVRGLALHPTKCKVQTNRADWTTRGLAVIEEGFSVEVLPEGQPLMILGTKLCLTDVTGCEIPSRIASGWRMFWAMKRLLLNRKASLNKRFQLFDSTVGSHVLWCTETWTPRTEEFRQLETARRAMLRRILGSPRPAQESWLDWIQRATHRVVKLAEDAGVRTWSAWRFERKYLWAGHVARRGDETWVKKVLTWRDSYWTSVVADVSGRPMRPARRRWMKFESSLVKFWKERGGRHWMQEAQERENWDVQMAFFVQWCLDE